MLDGSMPLPRSQEHKNAVATLAASIASVQVIPPPDQHDAGRWVADEEDLQNVLRELAARAKARRPQQLPPSLGTNAQQRWESEQGC